MKHGNSPIYPTPLPSDPSDVLLSPVPVTRLKTLQAPIRPAARLPKRSTQSSATTTKSPPPLRPSHKPISKHKAPIKASKRASKHTTLLSRLSKTVPTSKVSKRRRPSKKLVTGLGELEDALPETITLDGGDGGDVGDDRDGVKIKHKSLKSRPGAGRRKEKLVADERERFAKNLALMAAGSGRGSTGAEPDEQMAVDQTEKGSAERWAAIRGFISRTMETRDGTGKK